LQFGRIRQGDKTMPHLNNHLAWCLKDFNRLVKVTPDKLLAEKHFKKSEYNFKVLQELENLKRYDWALNVGFYSIYHCFLALIAVYGYESRNQSCTITVLLKLIEENKLDIDKDLILRFDALNGKPDTTPTIREKRETSTYGVESSIDLQQLADVKKLVLEVQRNTIRIIAQN